MNKFLIYLCCVLIALGGIAQDKNKMLSVKQMHEDLDFYFSSLKSAHPNPYIILTEKEWQTKIDSLKNLITKPLSKKEFYLHITTLNRFTDLHTRVVSSKKMIKQQNVSYLFPIFTMSDSTLFLLDKDSVKQTISAINGVRTDSIINFFLKKRNLVEDNTGYNALDIVSFWISEHFIDTNIHITTINSDNKSNIFTIYPSKKSKNGKSKRVYRLESDTVKSIAVFELNTFMPKKLSEQINFRSMIDKVFDTLQQQKIKRLYIDVTCNGGGLVAFEEYLLNHLIYSKETKVSWDLVLKQSKQRRKSRGAYPLIADGQFMQTRQYFSPSEMKNKFKGEVFVIQSRKSFSAASTLASHLQTFRKATVIGEECQIKAVYTDPIVLTLPNAKFLFSLATGFIRNVGTDKDKGVVPNIPYKIYNVFDTISINKAEEMRNSAKQEDKPPVKN